MPYWVKCEQKNIAMNFQQALAKNFYSNKLETDNKLMA